MPTNKDQFTTIDFTSEAANLLDRLKAKKEEDPNEFIFSDIIDEEGNPSLLTQYILICLDIPC